MLHEGDPKNLSLTDLNTDRPLNWQLQIERKIGRHGSTLQKGPLKRIELKMSCIYVYVYVKMDREKMAEKVPG